MADKKFSDMSEDEVRAMVQPAGGPLVDEVAEIIADWFGHSSATQPDRELADSIIKHIRRSS